MEGYLKVTPEQLIEAAGAFESAGQTISSLTSQMMAIVNDLKSVWQGEAQEQYSTKFTGLQDDIEKINRMIKEHVNDLNQMARVYQSAEDAGVEESKALLDDIVS